jgi:predicted permease
MTRRSEQDFHDEIEAHLALEAERLAAVENLSPADAAARAHRAFGNVVHAEERFYQSNRWRWLDQARQDLGYALRGLRTRPGFAFTALLTIGIGIGVNTAVFTLFYSLIARPLPVQDPAGLYNLYQQFSGDYSRRVDGMSSLIGWPEYQAYVAGNHTFSALAAYGDIKVALERARDGAALGQFVSCNYFRVLGTRVPLGRGFGEDECTAAGTAPVAVISHRLWRDAFASDSAVIGQGIELNHARLNIIGVAAPGFEGIGLQSADVWLPMLQQPVVDRERDSLLSQETSWLYVIGRLPAGASLASAKRDMRIVARELDARHPGRTTQVSLERGALLNAPEVRREGTLVGGVIGGMALLVLVIICANLMNLLLARGIARRREIAIRLALGGSRRRLISQLITESLVIALGGGAIGVALAAVLPVMLVRVLPLPIHQLDLSIDPTILGFALLLSTLTALAFGLVPALHATRMQLATAIKGGAAGGDGRHHPGRLRAAVVGVQIAGSTCLVILSAVLLRSASRQASLDPGYNPDGVMAIALNLPQLGYDSTRARALYADLTARLTATPGVERVALAENLPLLSRHGEPAKPLDGTDRSVQADWNVVSGEYLSLMQTPLVSGRMFTDAEAATGGERPAIINRTFATLLWPGADPLGHAFEANSRKYRVVGIAANASNISLAERPGPFGYMPAPSGDPRGMQLILRTRGDVSGIEGDLREITRALDPSIVVKAERLTDRMDVALLPAKISSLVSSSLGALALLLAMVGIYGVVSYGVSQRRQEIAVRLALGARADQVVRRMMRIGMPAAVSGLVIGILLAGALSQVLRTLITDIPIVDLVPFVAVTAGLTAIVALATWLPARGASRIQPASALRVEE